MLTAAFGPRPKAEGWADTDPRWYVRDLSGFVAESSGGVSVSAETIMRCSTVWAAVKFRAVSLAMCPPATYRRLDRGRVAVPDHPSQLVLRNPNAWQTGWRWRALMGVWQAVFGNAYNEAIAGPRSFADELRPLHPDRCRVKDQRADGTLVYEYTPPGGAQRILSGDNVLHIQDLSMDGIRGMAMYRLIRNVVSIALLAERHEETFLRKGTRVSGLLVTKGTLNAEQRKDLRDSVNTDFGGAAQTGTLGILPDGVDVKPLTLGQRAEQRAELTDQNIGSILRFLGVPGVVVGWQGDKASTYASAKEFFESGGIKHCILPILTNIEAEEDKFLLVAGDGLFIRHNLDVLLRANLKDRYDAYGKALGGSPFLSVNEVRETEDYDADPDPRHDEIRVPANMAGGGAPAAPGEPIEPARPSPPPKDDGGQENDARRTQPEPVAASLPAITINNPALALAKQYALDNATRVVRREIEAVVQRAAKHSKDRASWKAFVLESYAKHTGYVAEVMRIAEPSARAYCDSQAAALLAGGAAAAQNWETDIPPRLAAVAIEERAA